ncbi:MAG: glycerophosphoryl diester phosphodiesterase membrane domain-containing protein [Dehalococcoidia bacterium]|nr:glycerophosphoryl diester phosphodiesterase membrane domain-containing protein [Dehalococcoidia bacterium]MDZ4246228.1 glycerophosphoryl diester phosphodiesterase membrane domain-containing protein [Dehalococcoidia bacterium]
MVEYTGTPTGPVPVEPGVGSSYSHGFRQLKKCFLELLLITIIGIVITAASGAFGRNGNESGAAAGLLGVIGLAYTILLGQPVEYGVSFANLKAARGIKPEVKDMFESFKNYWNVVLAALLTGAIIIIGAIFFIVPGIYFACKFAFTPYLVVERKMEAIEAVKESWRLTQGHGWTIFFMLLLAILISIAGFLVFIVGIIFSVMLINMAFASLYHSVSPAVDSGPAPATTV